MVNSPEVPIFRVRFLTMMVSHVVFFAAIAMSPSNRNVVIPSYMFVIFALMVGWGTFEWTRLGPFLEHRYPREFDKLTRGWAVNTLRGYRFAFSVDAEDDGILRTIRRHWRWGWIEALSFPLVMFIVVVSATSVSKY